MRPVHVFLCSHTLLLTEASEDYSRFVLLTDPLDLDQVRNDSWASTEEWAGAIVPSAIASAQGEVGCPHCLSHNGSHYGSLCPATFQCMVTHVFYNDDCEFQVEENTTLPSPTKGNKSSLTDRGTSRLKRVEVNIFGFRATTRTS